MTTLRRLKRSFDANNEMAKNLAKSGETDGSFYARLAALHFLVESAELAQRQKDEGLPQLVQESHLYKLELMEWWQKATAAQEDWMVGQILCKVIGQRIDFHAAWKAVQSNEFPANDFFKNAYKGIAVYLTKLREESTRRPRVAIACGSAAIEQLCQIAEMANYAHRLRQSNDKSTTQFEADPQLVETMAHYIGEFVAIESITDALNQLNKFQNVEPRPRRFAPQAIRFISIQNGLRSEVLDDIIVPPHRKLRTLFNASSLSNIPLSPRAWNIALPWFEQIEPQNVITRDLVLLRDAEMSAFGIAVKQGEWEPKAYISYVERRLQILEAQAGTATLAVCEKTLFSGWCHLLLATVRHFTDDLTQLPATQALALIDRSGASTYRAEVSFFEQLASITRSFDGEFGSQPPQIHEDNASLESLSIEELLQYVLNAREHLDIWAFLSLLHNLRGTKPMIESQFGEFMANPPTQVFGFALNSDIEEIAAMMGVPADALAINDTETNRVVRVKADATDRINGFEQAQQLADYHRSVLASGLQELADRGQIEPSDFAPEKVDVQAVVDALQRHPRTAILIPGAPPEEVSALNVFAINDGELVRKRIEAPGGIESYEPRLRGYWELVDKLADDSEQPSRRTLDRLEDAMEELIESFRPWGISLAAELDDLGIERLLVVTRGLFLPQLPLEALPLGEDLGLFGEHFITAYIPSISVFNKTKHREAGREGGTLQIYGDGASREQMIPGRQVQAALAVSNRTAAPVSASQLDDVDNYRGKLAHATRLRIFTHGYHHLGVPFYDHLTLADDARPEHSAVLWAAEARNMPLSGMKSVELFVCEGLAHTRPTHAAGPADEPADLAHSFLIAGAQSVLATIWPAMTLPAALFMERFGLFLESGMSEVDALAQTRRDWIAAFADGGPVGVSMRENLEPDLVRLAEQKGELPRDERHKLMAKSFSMAIETLRRAWYGSVYLPAPTDALEVSASFKRMVSFQPPRSKQLATVLLENPSATVSDLINETLAPYRHRLAWAGWRVLLRSFNDWR